MGATPGYGGRVEIIKFPADYQHYESALPDVFGINGILGPIPSLLIIRSRFKK